MTLHVPAATIVAYLVPGIICTTTAKPTRGMWSSKQPSNAAVRRQSRTMRKLVYYKSLKVRRYQTVVAQQIDSKIYLETCKGDLLARNTKPRLERTNASPQCRTPPTGSNRNNTQENARESFVAVNAACSDRPSLVQNKRCSAAVDPDVSLTAVALLKELLSRVCCTRSAVVPILLLTVYC